VGSGTGDTELSAGGCDDEIVAELDVAVGLGTTTKTGGREAVSTGSPELLLLVLSS
jgi:hypothetical protein